MDTSWRTLYELAIAETDPTKKGACFKAAEEAINARVVALGGQISRDDLLAMREASSNLRTLKQEWKQSSVRDLRGVRPVRVLIADDQPIIRKVVRSTLQAHPHIEVVGEAEDGAKAIEEAKKLKPDVIVLNVTMPVKNGFEAAREIKTLLPETAIVILSSHADQLFIEEAKKLGVRAYVAKSKAAEALVRAVEAAIQSEDFVLID